MPSYRFDDGIVTTNYADFSATPTTIAYSVSESEGSFTLSVAFESLYGLDTGLFNERDWKEWEDWGLLKWGETDPSTVGYGLNWEDFD